MLANDCQPRPNSVDDSIDQQLVPSANRLVLAYGLSLLILVSAIATSYLILDKRISAQRTLIKATSYVQAIKLGVIESVSVLHDFKEENARENSNSRLKKLILKRANDSLQEISVRQIELLGTRDGLEKTKAWNEIKWIVDEEEGSLNDKLSNYRSHISALTAESESNDSSAAALPQVPLEAAGARYGTLFQGYQKASDQLKILVDESTYQVEMVHKVLTVLIILVLALVTILVVAPLWLKLLAEHKRLNSAHSKLFSIAYTDRETRLPNLAGLERNQLTEESGKNNRYLFVVRITNLDEITNLISSYHVKDMLLIFSDRLANIETNSTLDTNYWSRSGESEFSCLLQKHDLNNATQWAPDFHTSLNRDLIVDGVVVRPEVTMAVAGLGSTNEYSSGSIWEHQANARLALASFAPPSCWLPEFEPEMKNSLRQRNDLINEIEYGLANRQFVPYYQLKVDANTGNPCSMEVLARWELPDKTVLSPVAFIEAAENSGQIVELTYSIFDQVLADIQHWCCQGLPVGRVAINVAAEVLYHEELITRLSKMQSELPDLCKGLEIEITENIALGENIKNIESILIQIRSLGIEIAIDDFGTGYASLQTLVDLPFDVLKVDRCFLLPMCESGSGQEVVAAMIRLSKELNKRCVVEGVETEWQWKILAALGANELQGFYFSKPSPASTTEQILASNYGWKLAG